MAGKSAGNDASAPPTKSSQAKGGDKAASTRGTTSSATARSAASPAVPAASGPSRAPYVPQFSAATQMILKRMRGEPGGLSSSLASATPPPPASKSSQPPSTYASAKERHLFGSDKKMTPPQSSGSLSSSTTSSTLRLPSSAATKTSMGLPFPLLSKKRKHGSDDASRASSPADSWDYSEGIKRAAKTPKPAAASTPTTTKSGRHILKPDTYDPAAEDNMRKRTTQLGKQQRTAEQALCKRCTRMHSPANNQMVFCDGCNGPWHQRCHEPWIDDDVVRDPTMKWYCARCAARRERQPPKKKAAAEPPPPPAFGPWPKTSAHEKRAYLTKLPSAQLVDMLVRATDMHPDLPIFPVDSATPRKASGGGGGGGGGSGGGGGGGGSARGLFAGTSTEGLFSRGDANPTAPLNYIRKIPGGAKKSTMAHARAGPGSLQSKAAAQADNSRASGHQQLPAEEDASFTKLWPKPGMGMYSRLVPDEDDDSLVVDDNDHSSFSVIVFDERGRKTQENGVKVSETDQKAKK